MYSSWDKFNTWKKDDVSIYRNGKRASASKEQKIRDAKNKEFDVDSVIKWKAELIKIPAKNIYVHPDNLIRPYYIVKVGKFPKYKPYAVINDAIRYVKNGVEEIIHVQTFVLEYGRL
jgi:hypothetical protein